MLTHAVEIFATASTSLFTKYNDVNTQYNGYIDRFVFFAKQVLAVLK